MSMISYCKLFVGGLSFETTDDKLHYYFSQFGAVENSQIMRDPNTKRSRGFGFITFYEQSSAEAVMSLNDHIIDNRKVEAKWAVPRTEPPALSSVTSSYSSLSGFTSSAMPLSTATSKASSVSSTDRYEHFSSASTNSTRKVFVGGLHYETDDDGIYDYFSQFGKIETAQVLFNRETNKSRGFGFITYSDPSSVNNVFLHAKMHVIDGKTVEIKRAVPKSEAPPSRNNERNGYPSPILNSSRLYSHSIGSLSSLGGGPELIHRGRSMTAIPMGIGYPTMDGGYRAPSNSDGSINTYFHHHPYHPHHHLSPPFPSSNEKMYSSSLPGENNFLRSSGVWGNNNSRSNKIYSPPSGARSFESDIATGGGRSYESNDLRSSSNSFDGHDHLPSSLCHSVSSNNIGTNVPSRSPILSALSPPLTPSILSDVGLGGEFHPYMGNGLSSSLGSSIGISPYHTTFPGETNNGRNNYNTNNNNNNLNNPWSRSLDTFSIDNNLSPATSSTPTYFPSTINITPLHTFAPSPLDGLDNALGKITLSESALESTGGATNIWNSKSLQSTVISAVIPSSSTTTTITTTTPPTTTPKTTASSSSITTTTTTPPINIEDTKKKKKGWFS